MVAGVGKEVKDCDRSPKAGGHSFLAGAGAPGAGKVSDHFGCSDVRLLRQMSAALQIQVTSAIWTHANAAWSLKAGLVARWALPAISRALGIVFWFASTASGLVL